MFSSLFYFSVLVIARLNGCYYVGGAGREPAWSNNNNTKEITEMRGKRDGEHSGRAHFGRLFFGYGCITSIMA